MDLIKEMNKIVENIDIDLGNSNYKALVNEKKIMDNSNVEEVETGTFGAYEINGRSYIFGEAARSKKNTNKICVEKKALLGKVLYSLVEDGQEVNITTLLPLSLYISNENKEKYKDLLKGDYAVTNPNGYTKKFKVTNVEVCAEGFSSLVTDAKLLNQALYLVDVGGVDLSATYVNRTPVVKQSFTSERGMNIFYSELGKVLTSKLLETYTDKDAELLFNKYDGLKDDLKEIIDIFATEYIDNNIYKPLADIGYKSLIHKLILVGGGAIALQRYLISDSNITILPDALWSNVMGADIISKRRAK